MLKEWQNLCWNLSSEKADFWASARKILVNRTFTFTDIQDDLTLEHSGYTYRKMTILKRLYEHTESIEMAKVLWARTLKRKKYSSVSFHTYNHLLKGSLDKGSKRASKMGPCIQSVTLTYVKESFKPPYTTVDAFWRTTEIFKKFPADLVFMRDVLLPHFDLSEAPLKQINFHMANITVHPMYMIIPLTTHTPQEAIEIMKRIRKDDPFYHDWAVKWSARYLCKQHARGIDKFAQALMVKKAAMRAWRPRARAKFAKYLIETHPGHTNKYVAPKEKRDD